MNTKPHKIVKKAAKRISEARIQELEAENAKLKEANDHYLDFLNRVSEIVLICPQCGKDKIEAKK